MPIEAVILGFIVWVIMVIIFTAIAGLLGLGVAIVIGILLLAFVIG